MKIKEFSQKYSIALFYSTIALFVILLVSIAFGGFGFSRPYIGDRDGDFTVRMKGQGRGGDYQGRDFRADGQSGQGLNGNRNVPPQDENQNVENTDIQSAVPTP